MSAPNIEPDCTDREAGYLRSIAISLKRIADSIEAVREIFAEAANEGRREKGH